MRHLFRALTLLTVLALVGVSAASAQGRPQTRKGFWIGFGFGYGSLGLEGLSDREGAATFYLKMGGTPNPSLLLGGEVNAWAKQDLSGGNVIVGNTSFTAYYYPRPDGGLSLRAGVGTALYQVEGFDPQNGFGFVVGVAYDIRVGANTSLVPVVNFNWGDVEGFSQNVLELGIGVTFH